MLWKKKFRYTVIDYTDKAGIPQAAIIDFHKDAEKAQQAIYTKMIEVKAQAKLNNKLNNNNNQNQNQNQNQNHNNKDKEEDDDSSMP